MTIGERSSDCVSYHPGSGEDLPPCKGTEPELDHREPETTLSYPSQYHPITRSPHNQPTKQHISAAHFMYKVSKTCRGTETLTDILGEHEATGEAALSNPLMGNSQPARPTFLPTTVGQAECSLMMLPSTLPGWVSQSGCLTLLWLPPGTTCSCDSSHTAPKLRAKLRARITANSRALLMMPRSADGQDGGKAKRRRTQHRCKHGRHSRLAAWLDPASPAPNSPAQALVWESL